MNPNFEETYYKLIQVHHLMNQQIEIQAKRLGLNPSEYAILLELSYSETSDLKSLCQRLGLKKSAASKTIKQLITKGIVVSSTGDCDRRHVALQIAPTFEHDYCRSEALRNTFQAYSPDSCSLEAVNQSLDEIKHMLSF